MYLRFVCASNTMYVIDIMRFSSTFEMKTLNKPHHFNESVVIVPNEISNVEFYWKTWYIKSTCISKQNRLFKKNKF